MLALYLNKNMIFLCGGVNYDFDNVSNEAFLYRVHQKSEESAKLPEMGRNKKKEKGIGNNLMGINFEKLAPMRTRRFSHTGVYYQAGKLGYIYALGGRTDNDVIIKKCEKYSMAESTSALNHRQMD